MIDTEAQKVLYDISEAGRVNDERIMKILNGLVELLSKKNIITEEEAKELYSKATS
ncbi:TPA: hypothetical protein ACXNW8_003467 [Clostridium botulinum]|uniref:hypothetical protein n=1 Tax=Clostridium botulinum TaxID=1491 RepID=UPI001C9BB35E|nr:hypothetical protein [Clostridium botulinum]MBY6846773.1 hypothetical protein [Clostridium botulinum]